MHQARGLESNNSNNNNIQYATYSVVDIAGSTPQVGEASPVAQWNYTLSLFVSFSLFLFFFFIPLLFVVLFFIFIFILIFFCRYFPSILSLFSSQ